MDVGVGVGGWRAGAVVVLFGEWEGEQSGDGTERGRQRPQAHMEGSVHHGGSCVGSLGRLCRLIVFPLSFHPG
jgi:hypothetical protein